jgi:RNA polymerase sigma-70 factor (ECF subfamily)
MQETERRFKAAYSAHAGAVLAYALRRVAVAEDAADVVADTFLVAWRRRGELPPDEEVLPWLYGVARNVLANLHRAGGRRDRLGERLRDQLARRFAGPDPAEEVVGADAVRQAIGRLPELDREVLTLSVWEELEPREIAAVLDLDPVLVRTRLSRARSRLRTEIAAAGHVSRSAGDERGVGSVPVGEETR